jgi:hypothetical protein
MKHLLTNIKVSNNIIIAQFKVGNRSFDLTSNGKKSNISVDGCELFDCSKLGAGFEKIAHLVKDLVLNSIETNPSKPMEYYISADSKISNTIINKLKSGLDSSVKIINQSMEIPHNHPVKFDLEEVFAPDRFLIKLKEFAQALHDINETLKVCREDVLSLTHGRLINTMWGAKQTQQVIINLRNGVEEDEDWDKLEFYISMILKSIDRLTHKLNMTLFDVCDEEKKVVNTVLIPNVIQSFEKIKSVVSNVLLMLSNFVYIDEVFKKNTSYPSSWFINKDMFEDLKLDYRNLVLFALKIPRFEQEIIYPLDMMRHNFISKNKVG